MFFKKLEMHGFKSFPDPATIEFNDGITCIVGPNGSGKSNFSDAIRWVLGEQSTKMLRADKMDEVIFAGTANRKSRGMAEVTLTIDNESGILPIEYSEVAITRRMYRSGESEYLINDNPCRLKDIRELTMDTGIGVDGYSVIGQGKIEEIVSSKPENRREIFEESAGIVMYKNKKHEAERKLDNATNNLNRVNDIIAEIEGRIGTLKEDSEKAKEYLELKKRFEDLEINITLRDIENVEKALNTMGQDLEEFEREINKIKENRDNLNKSFGEGKAKMSNLQKLRDEASQNLIKKNDEINDLMNKEEVDSTKLNSIKENLARLEEEFQDINDKIKLEEGNKANLQNQLNEFAIEEKETGKELNEKIEAYNQCNEKAVTLLEELNQAKDNLFTLRSDLAAKNSELKSMESMKIALDKQKEELLQQDSKKKQEVENLKDDVEAAQKEHQECETKLKSIREELTKSLGKENQLKQDENNIQKDLDDYRIKKSQVLARKKTIEEMEANYEGYNYAVKFIMKSGQKGIEGVVADLMKVPQKYQLAIETALGNTLQNIVCEDDTVAKKAIEELKRNKAGRLTFLPVASIKGKTEDASKLKSKAGFHGIASDLVSYDSGHRNVFEYLLGRTAVVDDMDSAIALSKHNHNMRFVTLDGEIINVSGAITGGKFKNKSANILSRKGEIENLEKDIKALDKDIDKSNKELEKTQKDLSKIIEEKEQLIVQKNQMEIQTATAQSAYENLLKISEENEKTISESKNRIKNIDNDYKGIDKEIERLKEKIKDHNERITSTNVEIGTKTAAEESARIHAEDASGAITKVRMKETEIVHKKEGVEKIIEKIDQTLEGYNKDLDVKNLKKEEFLEAQNKILYGSDDIEEQVNTKKKEKEDLEGYLAQIKGEIEELETATTRQNQDLMNQVTTLNRLSEEKSQIQQKMVKRETQGEAYKQKLWDEFEISYAEALDHKKDDFAVSKAKKESSEVKERIRELGDVNVGAIKEYEQVGQRYEHLTTQKEDIETAMEELNVIIADTEKIIKKKFKENFDNIVVNFEETFKELFDGGHAELRLEGSDDPLEAGVEIVAQPPGKKLQNINLMSGGEKTMTAIALMFAVLKTKPTPFCILDEVEAALDDANIDRFAEYLRNFNDIQFTLITHQKVTMEHADVLYGVTMPERGISKVLSLKMDDDFDLD